MPYARRKSKIKVIYFIEKLKYQVIMILLQILTLQKENINISKYNHMVQFHYQEQEKKTIFPHLVRRKFLQLNGLLKVIHSLLVKRNSILINNYEIHWNESSEVIFKSIPLSSSINKVIKLKQVSSQAPLQLCQPHETLHGGLTFLLCFSFFLI